MSGLAVRAETNKLRGLLGVSETALPFLAGVPEAQLRRLRDAVHERLFAQDQPVFRRLGRIAAWLPFWLAVPLCHLVGPMLTARIVGEMPARRAILSAVRLRPAFVAEACMHLDPRRARDLIQRMPPAKIAAIAVEMLRREDYATMGRFVDFISDEGIRAVLDAIPDEAALLKIAFFMDSKNRLDHVVRLMPPERRARTLLLALDDTTSLLDEILLLIIHVNYALKRELGDLAAAQDEAVLERIVMTVEQQQLWSDLLPVVASLSEDSQRKVVNLPMLRRDPAMLEHILHAADTHDLWRITLPLLLFLDEPSRAVWAQVGALLPRDALERATQATLVGELWLPMIDLVRRMPREQQEIFADILREYGKVDSELYARVAHCARRNGIDVELGAD
ncbi:MAG: hypothetical protein ACT4PZ_22860 [Panacagrimonas sp.]